MSIIRAQPGSGVRHLGLDAFRAMAILLVLICHWSNNILFWFDIHLRSRAFFTGELGVSLFFALSGFLIGGILIDTASVAPTWRNLWVFLARRWLRTLPLYWVWLALLLTVFPPAQGGLGQALRFATMTQNLVTPMPSGWWFSVSWSLVIEEWFYVLFGTAAFLAFRLIRSDQAIWIPVAAFLIIPTVLRFALPGYGNLATSMFQIALLRMDQIAYGVAAAALYRRGSRVFQRPVFPAAIGLVLIASFWQGKLWWTALPDHEPIIQPNFLMVGCVLLLPLSLRLRAAPRWLEGLIRAISAQSYALYLMHMTLMVDVAQNLLFRHKITVWAATSIALISPFALSYLSYRLFEGPILRLRPRQETQRVASAVPGWATR